MSVSVIPPIIGLLLLMSASSHSASTRRDHSCRRLTAAFGAGGDRFLFFGDYFIAIGRHLEQRGDGDSYDLMNAPHPDAAFHWSIDREDYVFSGNKYYSYWTNYRAEDARMFVDKGDFFKDGLDAAGSLNGVTRFFKGCKYVESLPDRITEPKDMPEGVPCNLDAALTINRDLYLFKYDKVWKMTPDGMADGMPVDTSSVISLDDVTLCPEE